MKIALATASGPDDSGLESMEIALEARAERVLATAAGHILVFGWIADEGASAPAFVLEKNGAALPVSSMAILRHARADVASNFGGAYDYGFVALAQVPGDAMDARVVLRVSASGRCNRMDLEPERVSTQRLLDEVLAFTGFFQAHGGREPALRRFLDGGARALVDDLHRRDLRRAVAVQQVERFGPSRQGASFSTVLFGDVEAALFQPLLFARAGISFGEWIYTCNSPELGEALIRLARMTANLHDLPIRVVILSGNAGFGAANNVAVGLAASDRLVLVNPDVHPLPQWSTLMERAIQADRFGTTLRGGLLFYDEETLMHGGMYLDEDVFVAAGSPAEAQACRLLRVEHYDKGVPFQADDWPRPRAVPAVTGAVMAFDRKAFEAVGGFSSDFVYGHYEDADLCLRWGDKVGPVEVDPDIRLVHLEGQGSKTRRPHFHGAAIVNRHTFDARNRHFAEADRPTATGRG